MTRSVFFSFHYQRDAWRVQQVANIGAVEGQQILNSQAWEEVKRRGDQAIKDWIAQQMRYKRAVVVLVGAETAGRPWVQFEIIKAWNDKRPLVGIRIHGLKGDDGRRDPPGANPFAKINLSNGGTLADYVPLHNPAGSTGTAVYASIVENIESWVDGACRNP